MAKLSDNTAYPIKGTLDGTELAVMVNTPSGTPSTGKMTSAAIAGLSGFTADTSGNPVGATNKRVILKTDQNTELVKGLLDLQYLTPDAKAIIRYLDSNGAAKIWLQTHEYLVYFTNATVTAVNTTADTLTVSNAGNHNDNWAVTLSTTGTLPSPLVAGTTYYGRFSSNTYALYPTAADATAQTNKIDLTTAGTGTITLQPDLEYLGNHHQHFSIEASDSTGELFTRFSVQHGKDVVEIAFNRADLLLSRNTGFTNGNLFFTGGGGGGQLRHANSFGIVPNYPTNSAVTMVVGQSTTSGVASIDMGTTGSAIYRFSRNIATPINTTAGTANITLDQTHGTYRANATAAAFTVTLPTAVGRAGLSFTVKKTDSSANAVTIATTSSQTMDGAATLSLTTQYQAYTLQSDNTNWAIIAKV